MNRRGQGRRYASDASSSSVSQPRPRYLPLVECPNCYEVYIVRLVSGTEANLGWVFYKCENNQPFIRNPACRFYMWENEYEAFLHNIGVRTSANLPQGIADHMHVVGNYNIQAEGGHNLPADNTNLYPVVNIVIMTCLLFAVLVRN